LSAAAARGRRRGRPRSSPADRPLIQHRLEGDLLVSLTAGQHHGDRPPVALGAQVQLGREPTLTATKSFPRPSLFGRGAIASSPASVLMSANDGGIHEVDVPVDLAMLIRLGLQI